MTTICVAAGPFGRAVAAELDHIGEIGDVWSIDTLPADPASSLPLAEEYIVAAWRPDPERLIALATAVSQWRATILPIAGEGAEIVVGPLFGPEGGTCLRCARSRRLQHRQAVAGTRPLVAAGDHGDLDTAVFLPPSATVAAHAAAALLAEPARGDFITLGAITMSIRRGRAVATTDCASCVRPAVATGHHTLPAGARR